MNTLTNDLGNLFLRIGFAGTLLIAHGWNKLTHFSELSATFPDPIGVGSAVSLGLAVFAEAFCSAAVVLGLFTRLAAVPPIIMMAVAFFVIHAPDPWARKELAFLYGLAFIAILFAGGGRLALDHLIKITRR